MAPGSAALADHPTNVYLPERAVLPGVNAWLAQVFDREHRDAPVAALPSSQDGPNALAPKRRPGRRRNAVWPTLRCGCLGCGRRSRPGPEPEALIESLNAAQAQRSAARAELSVLRDGPQPLTDADIYAMLDELGDVSEALTRANPEKLRKLYELLRVEMVYDHAAQAVDVTVRPLHGGPVRVSEGRVDHYAHGLHQAMCWSTSSA